MKLFMKRTKGSITVLVALILVPTIFFTGFLVDLARIKLYGNQALMTADNYGEAVLATYDNLLKDLYGLFAVTQSEDGKNALNELEGYIKSSFHPNENGISWNALRVAGGVNYEGFMPYKDAEVNLSYEPVAGANLGESKVLSTQIGDFMKFRIAQTLFDNGDTVINAVLSAQDTEKDATAIDQKTEFDEAVGELVQLVQYYYRGLRLVAQYPSYLNDMKGGDAAAKLRYNEIINEESTKTYYQYVYYSSEITAARNRQASLKPGETLTEEEQGYIDMYNDYQNDPNARRSVIQQKFMDAMGIFQVSQGYREVDTAVFDDNFANPYLIVAPNLPMYLLQMSNLIQSKFGEIQQMRNRLQATLNDPNVSDDLKNGMQEELDRVDQLFTVGSNYGAQVYADLAGYLVEHNVDENRDVRESIGDVNEDYIKVMNTYLEARDDPNSPLYPLEAFYNPDDWHDFQDVGSYKTLYDSLVKWFDSNDNNAAQKAESKKNDAEAKQKQAENSFNADDNPSDPPRNIPSSINIGNSGSMGSLGLTRLIKTAASFFNANSLAEGGNKLLLKLYTVQYDFGMFSSRVTNVKNTEGGSSGEEKAASLTGYEMSRKINYLYQAELEYLFGGFKDSKSNWNDARNKILAFRAVMNYSSTYSMSEINTCIKAIADAAAAVNPLLGLAVSGALRLSVAALETAEDWNQLKQGESVVVFKQELQDLTAFDQFKDLIDSNASSGSGDSGALRLDYEQYLMVMLIFLTTDDQLTQRTGDLISLNVNTVKQGIGADGELSELTFTMGDAVTAVNATCAVHMNFAIMPMNFAQKMTSDDTYAAIQDFQNNSYKFTVTRGY